jgi:hypothetical protein
MMNIGHSGDMFVPPDSDIGRHRKITGKIGVIGSLIVAPERQSCSRKTKKTPSVEGVPVGCA